MRSRCTARNPTPHNGTDAITTRGQPGRDTALCHAEKPESRSEDQCLWECGAAELCMGYPWKTSATDHEPGHERGAGDQESHSHPE